VASADAAAKTSIHRGSRRVTTTSVASRSCQPGRRRARGSEEWPFSIQGAGDEARSWTWDEFTALPAEDVTVDIHCVTKWSELDTR
jgi:DMSO/TMAO reductase YedYZ molybdopterin-dependent catalytic subunit